MREQKDGDGKRVWGQGWQVAAERNRPGQSGQAPRLLPGSGAMCDDASRANHQSAVSGSRDACGRKSHCEMRCYLLRLGARP